MARRKTAQKAAWGNKFRTPDALELVGEIEGAGQRLAAQVREHLLQVPGIGERVNWEGIAWRWSLVYQHEADDTRAWAYLVPDPERPQLAIPLTTAMVETLPVKRLKKFVRDQLVHSRFVAGVYWPAWDLAAASQVSDLIDVLRRKEAFLAKDDACVARA